MHRLRRIACLLATLTVLISCTSCATLLNRMRIDELEEKYPVTTTTATTDQTTGNAPSDNTDSDAFRNLYAQNSDFRGWITYTNDNGSLNIDFPIVQSTDNDFYQSHNFYRQYDINGTLFFDYRNDFSSSDIINRNTVIYGNNTLDGKMFAGLNDLLTDIDCARAAPHFSVQSLYEKAEYKVFAVMLVNTEATEGIPFPYDKTAFSDNAEFASFLAEVKARSLYDYHDVDVCHDDEIISLSTDATTLFSHFNNGRVVVVARKVRENEPTATDVSQITCNTDVIMPYGWYVNQDMTLHPYYTDLKYVIPPLDSSVN